MKPRWHLPAHGRVAWKVEDAYAAGKPDVDCCFNGVVAKIELKYEAAWPARAMTPLWFSYRDKVTKAKAIVTAGQWNHLEQWRQAGGLAFVLIGIGREWLLLKQGAYANEPMTKLQLMSCACLTTLSPVTSYSSLATIPLYLEEQHGRPRPQGYDDIIGPEHD